jgi:hypothetical protein
VGDLAIGFVGELVDGQEALVGVKAEMLRCVIVGKVDGVVAIADDKSCMKQSSVLV